MYLHTRDLGKCFMLFWKKAMEFGIPFRKENQQLYLHYKKCEFCQRVAQFYDLVRWNSALY